MTPLLSIRGLRVGFGTRNGQVSAVNGISLDLAQGETLALVGESGCGKSLTALSVMGLLGDDTLTKNAIVEGSIRLRDGETTHELVGLERSRYDALRGPVLSMIFQEPMTALNPLMKVGDQVAEMLVKHRGVSRAKARARAAELLSDVGIPDARSRMRAYPHQLSGGQKQRVMIAIAMACDPLLLIADEPTTSLDVTIQSQILHLLKKVKADHGSAILFITHDLGVVAQFADRVAVMYRGKIVESATVHDLFQSPRHPYTKFLLRSLPKRGRRASQGYRLESIRGTVPGLEEVIPGCAFHPRCPYKIAECSEVEPPDIDFGSGHVARCLLAEELPQ